ncbi:MAG: Ldh family oxidoreductase [Christensenellales bacterium]|jgi:LDH2 family malate/lactate/ureidoglycolate dehydrogenase
MADRLVSAKILESFCKQLFIQEQVPEDEATIIANHLVEADLMGVSSHGVSRTGIYLKRLREGVVQAACKNKIDQEHAATIQWDACNSMGMVTGVRAMERCMEKAKESGICLVAVHNSNHFGMAGYYARIAAQQGMVGICGTNAPPNIAPWGSYKAYVGTNPIAFCAPRRGEPIVLDMAPSVVAMGKVILAAKLGKSIPEGWAITADGRPTTDANEGMKGTVLPIGGPKGYGISLFIDILSGILSGASFGPYLNNMWNDFKNPQDVGHFFIAIDISKFIGLNEFIEKIEIMAADIKKLPKNPGVEEIFLPGEIELAKKNERLACGIPLDPVMIEELNALAQDYGLEIRI